MRLTRHFKPFAPRSRRTIVLIVALLALAPTVSAGLSIWAAGGSRHRADVVEVAARQRTLAERYIEDILLVRSGATADPVMIGRVLTRSAAALLDGGVAPAVDGDDDDTNIPATKNAIARGQLMQERRLANDLTLAGSAFLAGRPVATVPLTAHEHIQTADPIQRLRILAALTSNVSLNAARTIAKQADHGIADLIMIQVALGVGGIFVSLFLVWALVTATRRQTAHFRSLVISSTDLVFVLGDGSCRYTSTSVTAVLGRPESDVLGEGFFQLVHEDDREAVTTAVQHGAPQEIVFRMRDVSGAWRYLEAHLTDLSEDRHIRGVVLNSRDITDRVKLELELTQQAQRDNFGNRLAEALEMGDEEQATFEVVERAMVEISQTHPMEMLLSDSSRAHLERVATSPTAGSPACPVESPFSCVAVRRGHPVVFETSEALNACPKLRERSGGPCSAVCVPISFMGRSLGVLHAAGPEGRQLDSEQVGQLTTLATQAGARIGTVRAFEKTQLQASTDGLTGLINRRTLEGHLRSMLRQRMPFALAMADLDHFKQLNDMHGHEAGDRSLRVFAQATRRALRDDDLIARWGGEEFVIVMPDTDSDQAVGSLERVRNSLAGSHLGGHPPFTASFGVTDSTKAKTVERLIQLADAGLYLSKQSGRDRITVGEAIPDVGAVDLGTARTRSNGNGNGRRARPAFHQAATEEEHHTTGPEIR